MAQKEKKSIGLFSAAQQSELDRKGMKKAHMELSEWKREVSEYIFSCVLNQIGSAEDHCLNEPLTDAITDFWAKMGAYDPDRGCFSHYALHAISVNYRARLAAIGRNQLRFTPLLNTDQEGNEYESALPESRQAETEFDSFIKKLALNQTLVAMILRFSSMMIEDKSDTRFRFYQMFFSEISVLFLQRGWPVDNERDTEAALDFAYIDFFMDGDFDSPEKQNLAHIRRSEPKASVRCECVSKNVPVEWSNKGWLHAAIPREFAASWKAWETTYPSDALISGYRKRYRTDYMKLMQE